MKPCSPKDNRLPVFQIECPETIDCIPVLGGLAAELGKNGLRVVLAVLPGHRLADAGMSGPCDNPLYSSGCDIVSLAGGQLILSHEIVTPGMLRLYLADLYRKYDVVLVVGETGSDFPKIRLRLGASRNGQPEEAGRDCFINSITDIPDCSHWIVNQLGEIVRQTPVWACVLIGGRSSRMGRAKHLLTDSGGRTWLENTVAAVAPFVGQVVLSGGGLVPESLRDLVRLPDIPGVAGPLTGILSAMRWQPDVSWLLVACDMPSLSAEALGWLLESRQPGRWGTVPKRSRDSHVEPLLAHYDSRCRAIFEEVLASGSSRIGDAARHEKIATPVIPAEFLAAWDNINTPEELQSSVL